MPFAPIHFLRKRYIVKLKSPLFVSLLALGLFLFLYFGGRTRAADRSQVEKERALSAESITPEQLLEQAKAGLKPNQLEQATILEDSLSNMSKVGSNTSDSVKTELLKEMAGMWYQFGTPIISGQYAEEIAKIENTDEAWSIAGTTFALGLKRLSDKSIREYGANRAIHAFEQAISLNPKNDTHRVNMALCIVEGTAQPMKGVMSLRAMLDKNPNNVLVLLTLARLSVTQTGEYQKAIDRLLKVLEIEPKHEEAHYLLGHAYNGLGDKANAKSYFEKCKQLSDNPRMNSEIDNILKGL